MGDPQHPAENDLPPRMLPARFGSCRSCGQRVLMIYRTEADSEGRPVRHDCATPPATKDPVVAVLAAHRLSHKRPALPGPGEAWTCTCGIFRVSPVAQDAHDEHVAEHLRECPIPPEGGVS